MTEQGTVERVFIASDAEAEMDELETVEALAGSGLRGDRYSSERENGTFVRWESDEERPSGYDLTLIEREAIEAIEREAEPGLDPGEHRRNLETSGVALNHLVGERFRVGETVCRGVRLCEPCDHLEGLTAGGVREALVHRGGLRADIVEGGDIEPGDEIVRLG